jgi:hypothetical protein
MGLFEVNISQQTDLLQPKIPLCLQVCRHMDSYYAKLKSMLNTLLFNPIFGLYTNPNYCRVTFPYEGEFPVEQNS